ncbi:MAG: hypothetical protein IKL07_09455 [Clostridium sp.]|nr:hypothetical protein [Clostridium sp.]
MRANRIRVDQINFLMITDCNMKKMINEHGTAIVTGVIEAEDESKCLALATSESYLQIYAVGSSGEACIFHGFIEDIEVYSGDIKTVTIKLATGTRLMDLETRTRTFQNVGMTYQAVLKSNEALNGDIGAQSKFLEPGSKTIENLIVQYKETDWEFAKRMASCLKTFIRPEYKLSGSKYYVGLNTSQAAKGKPKDIHNYTIKKIVNQYEIQKREYGLPVSSEDAFLYQFDSREIFELGDCVDIGNGKTLYVYEVDSFYEGEELMNRYFLRTRNGFLIGTYYNHKIIGASLEGTIAQVSRDQVGVNLSVDKNYSDHGSKLFPYSTVYSSPDGTGWYCMPENGDQVRLYFPTEKEKDAYVISSVHLQVSDGASSSSGGPAPRSDPSNKSIKNSAGKEILFTPTSLSLINPAIGSIVLDDSDGITIETNKSIHFKAGEFVEMHSMNKNVNVSASDALTIAQGSTRLILNKNVLIKGAKVKLQEKG